MQHRVSDAGHCPPYTQSTFYCELLTISILCASSVFSQSQSLTFIFYIAICAVILLGLIKVRMVKTINEVHSGLLIRNVRLI